MTYSLAAPRQIEHAVARLFAEETPVRVRVSEQIAFRDEGWLDLGRISLHAAARTKPELLASVRNGSFAWNVPEIDEVVDALRDLFGFGQYAATRLRSAEERLPALLNSMASIAVRTGLARPRFDAKALAEMPFRRPTTIVADTSGVLQGAMSFVADHLHPMARLKVPAILHMEVINQADRFLKTRRSGTARGEIMLGEHLLSQTGQRTLLRLELREDTEVERNLLISDPLRSAFKEDRDPDLRDLNLATPLRSYVDRMILESALQHQNYASPGHSVRLLTADQGLAKMAIAEGIKPLFFRATTADQFFGRPLTGSMLHPFSGDLIAVALPSVLWELATAFGRVRLDREGRDGFVEVVAIDRELGWSSYHSDDDLLWTRQVDLPDWPVDNASPEGLTPEMLEEAEAITTAPPKEDFPRVAAGDAVATRSLRSPRTAGAPAARAASGTRLSPANKTGEAFYRLRMGDLVALIDRMAGTPRLTLEEAMETLATKHPSSVSEYRRFLESAGVITVEGRDWVATERLVEISTALRELDRDRLAELLTNAPSYRITAELARSSPIGAPLELPMPARVQPTYQALGELTGILAAIPGEGIYPTPARPSLSDFTRIAIERYRGLGNVDGWVSVGEWLEALIREDGIHPTVARDALQEADGAGLLHRSTEGSTTDTRHDDHSLRVLRRRDGRPAVETVHLYRGDFLIPDKSSSSLRLQEAAN